MPNQFSQTHLDSILAKYPVATQDSIRDLIIRQYTNSWMQKANMVKEGMHTILNRYSISVWMTIVVLFIIIGLQILALKKNDQNYTKLTIVLSWIYLIFIIVYHVF